MSRALNESLPQVGLLCDPAAVGLPLGHRSSLLEAVLAVLRTVGELGARYGLPAPDQVLQFAIRMFIF